MDGYGITSTETHIDNYISLLHDHTIQILDFIDLLTSLNCRLDANIYTKLFELASSALKCQIDPENFKHSCLSHLNTLSTDDASIFALLDFFNSKYKECGPLSVVRLLDKFYSVESHFNKFQTVQDLMASLSKSFNGDHASITRALISHLHLNDKMAVLVKIMDRLFGSMNEYKQNSVVEASLRKLTLLGNPVYNRIACRAREILLYAQLPSWKELEERMFVKLSAACEYEGEGLQRFINEMVDRFSTHLDVLPKLFHNQNPKIRLLSTEIYIRRVYANSRIQCSQSLEIASSVAHYWEMSKLAECEHASQVTGERAISQPLQGGIIIPYEDLMVALHSLDLVSDVVATKGVESSVVYLAINQKCVDADVIKAVEDHLRALQPSLLKARIERVTVMVILPETAALRYFTFSNYSKFSEDCSLRHIEPALSYLLELDHISANYDHSFCYADSSGQAHVYLATSKATPKYHRLFIRILIRPLQTMNSQDAMTYFFTESERLLENVFEAVEAIQHSQKVTTYCNHIYFNLLPIFYTEPNIFLTMFKSLMEAYKPKFLQLRISQGEVRLSVSEGKANLVLRCRYFMSNPTGFIHRVQGFIEEREPNSCGFVLKPLSVATRDEETPVLPYPLLTELQMKRYKVHALETAYVYDFPEIFQCALELSWAKSHSTPPSNGLIEIHELDFSNGELCVTHRPPGKNSCGIVAWKIDMKTPECPGGRSIVVIANDISFQLGSFSVHEDQLFYEASKFARANGFPRIYIAANSGARMGLFDELKNKFRVGWTNDLDPTQGFEYLYLEEQDYPQFVGQVNCVKVDRGGKLCYKIIDIIGNDEPIGVENLMGSGKIAGETSLAYDDIFTITYVSGRTVGIGAYLARLGQRVVQKVGQPIILTGVAALNKLLGRDVYSSNIQIGGTHIMGTNGITHLVVQDDLEGVCEVLRWLSFVPATSLSPFQLLLPPIPMNVSSSTVRVRIRIRDGCSLDLKRAMDTGSVLFWIVILFMRNCKAGPSLSSVVMVVLVGFLLL